MGRLELGNAFLCIPIVFIAQIIDSLSLPYGTSDSKGCFNHSFYVVKSYM